MANTHVTPEQITAFTRGDCWVLALELNRRFGFELAFVYSWGSEYGDEPFINDFGRWHHALVRLPDLRLFDIEGPGHPQSPNKQHWISRAHPGEHIDYLVTPSRREVIEVLGHIGEPYPGERDYPEHSIEDAITALMLQYPECFVRHGDAHIDAPSVP